MPDTQLATQGNNQNETIFLTNAVKTYLANVQTKSGKKPSESDVENFINICVASKLNPFKKQAHLVGYDSKSGPTFTTVIGIDGQRAIAMRTGLYAGCEQVEMTYKKDGTPDYCVFKVKKIVGTYIADFISPPVYFEESVQTVDEYIGEYPNSKKSGKKIPNPIWSKRPKGQLSKCAEGMALRMAFPDELGGVYNDAEISPDSELKVATNFITPEQIKILKGKIGELAGVSSKPEADLTSYLLGKWGFARIEDMSPERADQAIEALDKTIEATKNKKQAESETIDANITPKATDPLQNVEPEVSDQDYKKMLDLMENYTKYTGLDHNQAEEAMLDICDTQVSDIRLVTLADYTKICTFMHDFLTQAKTVAA